MHSVVSSSNGSSQKVGFKDHSFDKYVDVYDSVLTRLTHPWAQESIKIMQDSIQTQLEATINRVEPFTFLDAGAGTGTLTLEMMQALPIQSIPSVKMIAADTSSSMLDRLKTHMEDIFSEKFTASIEYMVTDCQTLEKVDDASVNVIGSNFAMAFFPDVQTTWLNAFRVLKKGGIIFATIWDNESANFKWNNGIVAKVNKYLQQDEKLSTVHLDWSIAADLLIEAGFQDVTVHHMSHTLHIKDREELVYAIAGAAKKANEVLGEEGAKRAVQDIFEEEAKTTMYKSNGEYATGAIDLDMRAHIICGSKL